MMEAELVLRTRLDRLERRLRWLVAALVITVALSLLGLVGALNERAFAQAGEKPGSRVSDVLRVRELDIVDRHGVERVKIASPLPAPIIDGRRRTRGAGPDGTLSGILLFDADGIERSGYATADQGYSNVLFTLDDKTKQHVLFLTEPTGAATLRLFNGDTKDRADIAVDEHGPSITLVRHGQPIFRQPALARSDGQRP